VSDPGHGVRVVAAGVNVMLVAAAVVGLVLGRAGAAEPIIRSLTVDVVSSEPVVDVQGMRTVLGPGHGRGAYTCSSGSPASRRAVGPLRGAVRVGRVLSCGR
jgi:hypothetical protein